MANRAMPIESAAAPVSPALFTQSSRTGWLCQCLQGQDLEEESGGPFALLAPLGVALLVLTLPFQPFLEGPFAGVIQ